MKDDECEEPREKKVKLETSNFPVKLEADSAFHEAKEKKTGKTYLEAVEAHPFYDNAHSVLDVYSDSVFRDAQGTIVGMMFRNAIPEAAAASAASVLRSAATKSSLRSNIYGGDSPSSGVAGYFDYRGSPITYKSRKTSFTHANAKSWPKIFPVVNYVNDMYKRFMPDHWAAQNASIPDVVRINGSVFSTLTINSRFRTAHHTDAGDFDGGYSCITCLEGEYKGLALTFDKFRVCFHMKPRDLVIFKPHHFHSNTEAEVIDGESDWKRLTCVFYYRSQLGEAWSYEEYRRRQSNALRADLRLSPLVNEPIVEKPNGVYSCRPATAYPETYSPFTGPCCSLRTKNCAGKALQLHLLLLRHPSLSLTLFGEALTTVDGIPERSVREKIAAIPSSPPYLSGGFSEAYIESSESIREVLREDTQKLVSKQLWDIWVGTLNEWFTLLKDEWDKLLKRNAERVNFVWNNQSEMSRMFFELCDVAKQIMITIYKVDNVSKEKEQHFWAAYAVLLNEMSVSKLKMPREALSLKKLNVKLKDYAFGGTRYFKDMSPEEQKRRLARKKKLEEAMLASPAPAAARSDWLENDSFDYQSEDEPVDFKELGLPLPPENTARFDFFSTTFVPQAEIANPIHVVVVLPRPSADRASPSAWEKVNKELMELSANNSEYARLLGNGAAQRLLATEKEQRRRTLPSSCVVENVHISFVFAGDPIPTPSSGNIDFLILQHVLSTIKEDKEASAFIEASLTKVKSGALLLVESDLYCRNYYTIRPQIRKCFMEAASRVFPLLHEVYYGQCHPPGSALIAEWSIRPRTVLEEMTRGAVSRYKFSGSPLNTLAFVLPG